MNFHSRSLVTLKVNIGQWKYICFALSGNGHQWHVVTISFLLVPFLFTCQVITLVIGGSCARGYSSMHHHDLLLIGSSPQIIIEVVHITVLVLPDADAGLVINVKKSDLTPSQELV